MEWAVKEFRKILTDTNELHGWRIPQHVVEYEARILASKVDKPDWKPKNTYAETVMQISTDDSALAFGNTCWFTRSVFPELGQRRGINDSYYVELGRTAYSRVLRTVPSATVQIMHDHFEFLAECTYTAIRHYGDFRSMWD